MTPPDGAMRVSAFWRGALALSMLLYLFPFAVLRTPWYERWFASSFGPALDYPFTLHHHHADVIIFGDSSAGVGIDPRLLAAELHVSAVNLPNTAASLHLVGDLALKSYLAANAQPRLIVFYFAHWNLDFAHDDSDPLYLEGEEVLLRRGDPAQIRAFARANPLQLLKFPFDFYRTNPRSALHAALLHQHPASDVKQHLGYFDPLSTRPPLPDTCTLPYFIVTGVPHTTVRDLVKTYQVPGTRVLVYLAPMPACTNAAAIKSLSFADLAIPGPIILPAKEFKQDREYVHPRPEAVALTTHLLAQAIQIAVR